jgi:hypothetical protein
VVQIKLNSKDRITLGTYRFIQNLSAVVWNVIFWTGSLQKFRFIQGFVLDVASKRRGSVDCGLSSLKERW